MRTFECTWRVIVNVTIRWRGVCTGLQRFSRNDILLWGSLSNVHYTLHRLRHLTPMEFSVFSAVRNKRQTASSLSTDFYQKMYKMLYKISKCLISFGLESFVFQFAIQNLKFKIYRTIIFPVVLCGCEIWSLTLREERRLMVFENRVLRRIFGPKRDEVTGERRKIHNEELSDLYSSPIIFRVTKSRRMKWAWRVARMEDRRCVY